MTPLLRFRLWLHEATALERLLGVAAIVAAMALLVWAVRPTTADTTKLAAAGRTPATSVPTAAQPAATAPDGAPVPTNPQGTASRSDAGQGPAGPAGVGGVAEPANGPAACPSGATDVGVTDSSISIAVIVIDLGAVNSLVTLPSYEDQVKAYETLLGQINAAGGVQCRKVVASYYRDNILDPSQEHALCLEIEQQHPFAVINNFYSPQEVGCIGQRGMPNFWYTPPLTSDVAARSPYVISFQPDYNRLIRTMFLAAKQLGWFSDGGRIGLLESTCFPEFHDAAVSALREIGVDPGQTTEFTYNCQSTYESAAATAGPSPTDQQAAVAFKSSGVDHVINLGYSGSVLVNFTKAADNQSYKPKYLVMDDVLMALIENSTTPPGQSLDGALAITTKQSGAVHSNIGFSPATDECERTMQSVGLPSPKQPGNGPVIFGYACTQMALFAAAASHAPGLTRDGLSTGLVNAGPIDGAFPVATTQVTDPAIPTGGHSWRSATYHYGCNCFMVTDPAFRPDFP